jgi:hypothetical protein
VEHACGGRRGLLLRPGYESEAMKQFLEGGIHFVTHEVYNWQSAAT